MMFRLLKVEDIAQNHYRWHIECGIRVRTLEKEGSKRRGLGVEALYPHYTKMKAVNF